MAVWHEDDEFWGTAISGMLRERWDAASGEVEKAMALLNVEPPAAVLDLCCGIGRHSIDLARRGFTVTGVDRTVGLLDEARRLADADELAVEFVEQDMRTFRRPDAFDAAINMLTSFGYFEDPDEDRLVISNLYDSLKSGGAVLLDMMGKENLARIFTPRDWNERGDETWLFERKVASGWSWIENRWILIKDGQRKEFKLAHRLYSAAELSQLVKDCGFDSVEVYGDLDGAPYDHEATRLVVIARK